MLLRMSTYKKILLSIGIAAAFTLQAQAQQSISGRVLNSDNQPIADVVISCPGCSTVRTDAEHHPQVSSHSRQCRGSKDRHALLDCSWRLRYFGYFYCSHWGSYLGVCHSSQA